MTIVLAPRESADDLTAGGNRRCPRCGGELRRWGWARWRVVRDHADERRYRPRRVRCRACSATQVVLPADVLVRRRDAVTVVGAAWEAAAAGAGARRVAARVGVPVETARGWLRRVRDLVRPLGDDGGAAGGRLRHGLRLVVAAAHAEGYGDDDVWRFASHRSQGRLLLRNTSWPFAPPGGPPMP